MSKLRCFYRTSVIDIFLCAYRTSIGKLRLSYACFKSFEETEYSPDNTVHWADYDLVTVPVEQIVGDHLEMYLHFEEASLEHCQPVYYDEHIRMLIQSIHLQENNYQ